MDAFESIVSEILWRDGYWVRTSFKVDLTQEDKAKIERPSSPRWELDVLAYSGSRNEILVVECKSYLDSGGVSDSAFNGRNDKFAARFKLFNDQRVREVVTHRLCEQLADLGLTHARPKLTLALACGKIATERDRALVKERFAREGWLLWDEAWLRQKLDSMSKGSYENSVAVVVAKLLLRS